MHSSALEIQLKHNGAVVPLDSAPIIESGRTLIPARAAFDMVGLDVTWNGDTQTASATHDDYRIDLKQDTVEATVNGDSVTLDVPARMVNNRIYVPVRFVAETLGADIRWDEKASTVNVYTHFLDEPVKFADPFLREAIYARVGKQTGQSLFKRDVTYLVNLDLSGRKVGSLEGLNALNNLKTLNLENNSIQSLRDIRLLGNLHFLNLKGNNIVSIEPLSSLTKLEKVDLRDNDIENISPVTAWYGLKELLIAGNRADNNEELSPLYYLKDQIKTDVDISGVEEPDQDTWNLRAAADHFRLEVQNGVYWRPATAFGSPLMKNDELDIINQNTPSGKASQIRNLYELLQYLQHVKVTVFSDDRTIASASTQRIWKYPETAGSTLTDMTGSEVALAGAAAYTLCQDYLESGYVVIVYPDRTQKVLNYLRTKRNYVVKGDDDEDDKSITVPEYALYDIASFLKNSPTPASIEDGSRATYDVGYGVKSNIHTAETLKALTDAYTVDKKPALVYAVQYVGDGDAAYPMGTYTDKRGGSDAYYFIPKSPENLDEDLPRIEAYYSILFDDPNDSLLLKYAENDTTPPTWD